MMSPEQQPPESRRTIELNDESSSHNSESSYTDGSSTGNKANKKKERRTSESSEHEEVVATRESRQLCWLRGIVLIALLLASFMVSSVIFYSSRKGEAGQFETKFYDDAQQILHDCENHIRQSLRALDTFGVAVTSDGHRTSSTFDWPYAVIPDFGVRAESVKTSAKIGFLGLAPRVTDNERVKWETSTSSTAATNWVEETLLYEEEFAENESGNNNRRLEQDLQTPIDFSTTNGIAQSIYRKAGDSSVVDEGPSPYYPMWYHSPVQKDLINYNILTHRQSSHEAQIAIDSQQVVISRVVDTLESDVAFQATDKPFGQLHQPGSNIFFPIFSNYDRSERELVGLLVATFDWRVYLSTDNGLPTSANGIDIVLANACGDAFTFQIQDEEVVFVGEGDWHDQQFDDLVLTMDISDVLMDETHPNNKISSNGIELNDEYCPSSLHVFPSSSMRRRYYSNNPVVFTILIVVVFIFTAIVFQTYDRMVERRQKKVAQNAKMTHQIVSSLFPAVVRNRLFGQNNKSTDDDEGAGKAGDGDGNGGDNPRDGHETAPKKAFSRVNVEQKPEEANSSSNPIADKYHNTTVMFADIAGFTQWSSTREPSEVFTLLETIYAAFDKLADRRKVFKVETIGDCYMAVTGLPNPQPDHAVIMVRFAWECLRKMTKITKSLETKLGPDTTNLSIRVGLHSGAVTAGVLRGQKSRFQLFGDTVNTAARMESTGLPRRVQCSQTTAELLRDAGKVGWIESREDTVYAKGKGELSTFWVTLKVSSSNGNNDNVPSSSGGASESGGTGSLSHPIDDDINTIGRTSQSSSPYDDDDDDSAAPAQERNKTNFVLENSSSAEHQRLVNLGLI